MSDLVERVLSAIEAVEQAGVFGPPPIAYVVADGGTGTLYMPEDVHIGYAGEETARSAVLRRCAADRKILALHPQADPPYLWMCDLCRDEGQNLDCTYPCDTLRLLAEGYGITDQEEQT